MAKCWSYGGQENEKIKFLCFVELQDQSENGLVQIKYRQTGSSTLIWNGGIEDNYQITLKEVNLTLVKAYDMTLETTWKFKIDVTGASFPPGAQIIIGIFIGRNPSSIICTSLNNALIICDSGTSSKTDLITISNTKLERSTVNWVVNLQIDYLIFVNIS